MIKIVLSASFIIGGFVYDRIYISPHPYVNRGHRDYCNTFKPTIIDAIWYNPFYLVVFPLLILTGIGTEISSRLDRFIYPDRWTKEYTSPIFKEYIKQKQIASKAFYEMLDKRQKESFKLRYPNAPDGMTSYEQLNYALRQIKYQKNPEDI